MDEPGKVAYDAYCESVGGVSKFTGEKLPVFEDQDADIRRAWNAAAEAVKLRYGAIY
jgi:hypothetical protein